MITNTHVSTPYTFSVFETIERIARHARDEGIAALGINDVNTLDGFKDFMAGCRSHGIYPLFNVGFLVRCEDDRIGGGHGHPDEMRAIRNVHGKALRYPATLSGDSRNLIASIWKASQDRIWKMIDLLNQICENRHLAVSLNYNDIRSSFAKGSLLDRHLARALYASIISQAEEKGDRLDLLRRLFDDDSFDGDLADTSKMEQEIHFRLLTQGKQAYVDEPTHSFMNFFQAKQVILQAGGIPCYQCSFDGADEATVGSKGPAVLAKHLTDKGILAVEFITRQTTFEVLNEYMHYFDAQYFCVTAGTGPPAWSPGSLVPTTIDGRPLDEALNAITYRGACILAAHQELHQQKRRGFIDETGKRIITPDQISELIQIGDQAIARAVTR